MAVSSVLMLPCQMIRLDDESSFEKKLKEPLVCLHCDAVLKNMPKLKEHLQDHFDEKAHVAEGRK